MPLTIVNPTTCRIPSNVDPNSIRKHLSYTDRRIDYEIQRLKRSLRWKNVSDPDVQQEYQDQITQLNSERKKNLLFEDSDGHYTLSGLAKLISEKTNQTIENTIEYPEFEYLPYQNNPEFEPRQYQVEAHDQLIQARHGAVEIGTGLGKSKLLEMLIKTIGLKTTISAPTISIAGQLFDQLIHIFGKKRVGQFFAGKKEIDKLITVSVAASLNLIEENTPAYIELSKTQVFCQDESHLVAAETLKNISLGLFGMAPFRFFVSGTQMRADGLEIVLKGITGPIVYSLSVGQGIEQGYLAKPVFRMIPVVSRDRYRSDNIDKMTNHHLRYNMDVIRIAAELANKSVQVLKRQTLILVDEIEQYSKIVPFLRVESEFAHGPLTAANKQYVPAGKQNVKAKELVSAFNDGKIPVLVGTSCISMGTDIRPVGSVIYLVGGCSEIQCRQAVGRGTRGGSNSSVTKPEGSSLWPWSEKKTDFYWWDFNVSLPEDSQGGMSCIKRHSLERKAIYEDIYKPVLEIKLT